MAEADERLTDAAPDMYEALKACRRLIDEALPQFNWGASSLDASAIGLLNETPRIVASALAKATAQRVSGDV